jgi:hypothetical protein
VYVDVDEQQSRRESWRQPESPTTGTLSRHRPNADLAGISADLSFILSLTLKTCLLNTHDKSYKHAKAG